MPDPSQFTTDRSYPGRWMVTFSKPPINMFVPTTIVELGALMTDLEADPSLKVVVFQSANPDFFIAHLDVSKAAERPGVLDLWRAFVLRLSSTPVVSIAKIRGRTRGIGNEFVLSCDMRFASRQSALFGNPELGVGLVPGGGALEWLPRLVGRSRALEIVLSGDDFDADIAERYGWVNRTLDDDDLDSFVDALVRRLASFDREALGAAKAQINRFGVPTAAELQSSNDLFFPTLAWPSAQARRAKIRNIRLRSSQRLRIELRPVPSLRSGRRTTITRVGFHERRSVIDTVAEHGHCAALRLQCPDPGQFLVRQQVSLDLAEFEGFGHSVSCRPGVPRQENGGEPHSPDGLNRPLERDSAGGLAAAPQGFFPSSSKPGQANPRIGLV